MMEGLGFFAKPFPVLNYNACKDGERSSAFDPMYMISRVCSRADYHHHLALHPGRHRGGERGPALSSEPRPVFGVKVHLVLQ